MTELLIKLRVSKYTKALVANKQMPGIELLYADIAFY